MIVVIIMTIVVILIIIGNNTNALELGLAYCQTASNGNIILQNGVGPGHEVPGSLFLAQGWLA